MADSMQECEDNAKKQKKGDALRKEGSVEDHPNGKGKRVWTMYYVQENAGYLNRQIQFWRKYDESFGAYGRLYSDMQEAEKRMAEWMDIKVLGFEFKEAEVSEMKPNFPTGALKFEEMKRDETAFKLRLEGFLFEHGMGSAEK